MSKEFKHVVKVFKRTNLEQFWKFQSKPLMYADDSVVFSSSSSCLQQFLNICACYGLKKNILYNSSKGSGLICWTKEDVKLNFPFFKLSSTELDVCHPVTYLSHVIDDKMTDDNNIH